jgi:hypothetical protein
MIPEIYAPLVEQDRGAGRDIAQHFASTRRLAVVGRLPAHPFPLQITDHDMNSSAFGAP